MGEFTGRVGGRGHAGTDLGLPESTIEASTAAHPTASDRTWTSVYDAVGRETQ